LYLNEDQATKKEKRCLLNSFVRIVKAIVELEESRRIRIEGKKERRKGRKKSKAKTKHLFKRPRFEEKILGDQLNNIPQGIQKLIMVMG